VRHFSDVARLAVEAEALGRTHRPLVLAGDLALVHTVCPPLASFITMPGSDGSGGSSACSTGVDDAAHALAGGQACGAAAPRR
jgi:hypothetical protein